MLTGVPRGAPSICQDCNKEAADAVIKGDASVADFRDRPGIIEAEILEEAGRLLLSFDFLDHDRGRSSPFKHLPASGNFLPGKRQEPAQPSDSRVAGAAE